MKLFTCGVFTVSIALAGSAVGQQVNPSPPPRHHGNGQAQRPADAPARPQRTWQAPAGVRPAYSGSGNAGLRSTQSYTPRQFPRAVDYNRNRGSATAPRYRAFNRLTLERPDVSPRTPRVGTVGGVAADLQPTTTTTATPRPRWSGTNTGSAGGTTPWAGREGRTGRDRNWTNGGSNWSGRDRSRNGGSDWSGRNWTHNGGTGGNYNGNFADAYRRYGHHHHDRDWWRSHHDRIILINRGYYYWDAGWWYPAWGYDPTYSYYAYDGPIYAYNDWAPDETITRVQEALREEGYYFGAVDGELGPMTRQALAAWQRDHGLAITTVIDEPTVNSLGL